MQTSKSFDILSYNVISPLKPYFCFHDTITFKIYNRHKTFYNKCIQNCMYVYSNVYSLLVFTKTFI